MVVLALFSFSSLVVSYSWPTARKVCLAFSFSWRLASRAAAGSCATLSLPY